MTSALDVVDLISSWSQVEGLEAHWRPSVPRPVELTLIRCNLATQVIVPKARNEILGVVIVESGWGSMLPTVVIANLAPAGAAARCGQLNIGDQIIAINGISLVGLPLSTCQTYIKVTDR